METTSQPLLHPLESPAGPGSIAPRLSSGPDGGVLLTWLEPAGEQRWEVRLASWNGAAWDAARTATAGDDFFANWADTPSVAAAADGTLLVHWLRRLGGGTYDYGVDLKRSADGGATWDALGLLHDDETPAEHGFVSLVPDGDGVQAFWLDGRAMPGGEPMQLRTTRLDPADGFQPRPSTLLDERVCECCSTDAALTSAGPLVVYRDRDGDEIRDIGVVRAVTDGWSEPAILADDGWQIHGCPVNGPAVAASGERVAVAWFSAPEGTSQVRVAFSDDAGASFTAPVVIDGDGPAGRVDVELDGQGGAFVTWLGTGAEGGEIRLRHVSRDGKPSPANGLVATSMERSAGVPHILRTRHPEWGEGVLLTWVEDAETRHVRTGFVSIAAP